MYEIWANGGTDPWPEADLTSADGTFLCYGPRGCGKTFLAERFFAVAQRNVLKLNAVEVLRDPHKGLSRAIGAAREMNRCGLLIEDLDLLIASLRSFPPAHQLLIDELRHPQGDITIFATATHPEEMRVGELDVFKYILPVFYGDQALREVTIVAAGNLYIDPDVDFEEITRITEWWSALELVQLLATAPLSESRLTSHGTITHSTLKRQIELISSNIVREHRAQRMRELLIFTVNHSTSNIIQEEIKYRFGPEFVFSTERVPLTLQIQELVVNNQTLNIKQAGVVQTGGTAKHIDVHQTLTETQPDLNLTKLADDLEKLLATLHDGKFTEATKKADIQAVSSARGEAEKGNSAGALKYLSKVGTWVLDTAKDLGVAVAAEAIKRASGL